MAITFLPELPEDTWDLSEWLELVAREQPGGGGAHSHQSYEETLAIQIRATKARSALQQLLGWAWADDGPPYRLHREAVPVQHPTTPWLWVDGVAVTPHNPLGTLQTDLSIKAKRDAIGFKGYAPAKTTNYSLCNLHVRFRNVWWRLWPDWDPAWQNLYAGKEWIRSFGNTSKTTQLDLLSAEGAGDSASLYFADGNPAFGITAGVDGTAFNGTQYVRQQKTTFRLVWKNVPLNYTCGEIDFTEANISSFLLPYPERLIAAMGHVNDTPFPGANSPYARGTLLLAGIEETLYQQPVATDSEFGLLAADYVFTFEHSDPPRDPDAVPNPPSTSTVARGHNLVASRVTRYWYLVTSGTDGAGGTRGTYSGQTVLPYADFHNMFYHRDDPDHPIP